VSNCKTGQKGSSMTEERKVAFGASDAKVLQLFEKPLMSAYRKELLIQCLADGETRRALTAVAEKGKTKEHLEEAQSLVGESVEKTFDDIFAKCSTFDGKKISRAERTALCLEKSSLVYGEVEFKSLSKVLWDLDTIVPKSGGNFYDIGSGTGRGVFAALLLHDFAKCTGIEILDGLFQASNEVLKRFDKAVRATLGERQKNTQISFVRGSLLDVDWSDGDVVFANSTCFEEDLMDGIAKRAEKLKTGAYIITLTKRLNSDRLRLIYGKQMNMSWGFATVNLHQRI